MAIETMETTSWGQRLRQSMGSVVLGGMLAASMLGMLFWNEGRAVHRAQALDEGAGAVRAAELARFDPRNEGQLVHVSGPLRTAAALTDPVLGVQAPAVRLERAVEMFQWVEERSTEKDVALGGSETQRTRYSYRTEWKASAQDASKFQQPAGHSNPPLRMERAALVVPSATLGIWSLGSPVLQTLGDWQPWAVPAAQLPAVQQALQKVLGANTRVHAIPEGLFVGANPAQPQVGDYRIRYRRVPVQTISIVAKQSGTSLVAYPTRNGQPLLLTQSGSVPAQAMFTTAHEDNSTLSWVLRAVGLGLLMLALQWVLRPLSVLASVVPMLGTLVAWGTGTVAAVLGLLLGALTISVAWLVYRPWVSLTVLVLAAAVAAALVWRKRRKARAHVPATMPQPQG